MTTAEKLQALVAIIAPPLAVLDDVRSALAHHRAEDLFETPAPNGFRCFVIVSAFSLSVPKMLVVMYDEDEPHLEVIDADVDAMIDALGAWLPPQWWGPFAEPSEAIKRKLREARSDIAALSPMFAIQLARSPELKLADRQYFLRVCLDRFTLDGWLAFYAHASDLKPGETPTMGQLEAIHEAAGLPSPFEPPPPPAPTDPDAGPTHEVAQLNAARQFIGDRTGVGEGALAALSRRVAINAIELGASYDLPLSVVEDAVETAGQLIAAAISATVKTEWVIQTPDGEFLDVVEAPDARNALKVAARRRDLPSIAALLEVSGARELLVTPLGDSVRVR